MYTSAIYQCFYMSRVSVNIETLWIGTVLLVSIVARIVRIIRKRKTRSDMNITDHSSLLPALSERDPAAYLSLYPMTVPDWEWFLFWGMYTKKLVESAPRVAYKLLAYMHAVGRSSFQWRPSDSYGTHKPSDDRSLHYCSCTLSHFI